MIYHGDCLDILPDIDDRVDMILADPPYGTTICKWDSIIDLDMLWPELKRLIKPDGAICMFAGQPFTSQLLMSNVDMFKYELIWEKTRSAGFAQAPYRFMSSHESILVFGFGGTAKNAKTVMKYNPQGLKDVNIQLYFNKDSDHKKRAGQKWTQTKSGYPSSVLKFKSVTNAIHPTQKPIPLLEYLIKSFTNPKDTVLDFCMGSGSTGVAATINNRKFIGIEKEKKYFDIADERIYPKDLLVDTL